MMQQAVYVKRPLYAPLGRPASARYAPVSYFDRVAEAVFADQHLKAQDKALLIAVAHLNRQKRRCRDDHITLDELMSCLNVTKKSVLEGIRRCLEVGALYREAEGPGRSFRYRVMIPFKFAG